VQETKAPARKNLFLLLGKGGTTRFSTFLTFSSAPSHAYPCCKDTVRCQKSVRRQGDWTPANAFLTCGQYAYHRRQVKHKHAPGGLRHASAIQPLSLCSVYLAENAPDSACFSSNYRFPCIDYFRFADSSLRNRPHCVGFRSSWWKLEMRLGGTQ
jgi:hypothetical protein